MDKPQQANKRKIISVSLNMQVYADKETHNSMDRGKIRKLEAGLREKMNKASEGGCRIMTLFRDQFPNDAVHVSDHVTVSAWHSSSKR